jgi:hypothetical protein
MVWCIIVIVLVLLSLPPLMLLFKKQVLPYEVDRQWKDDFLLESAKAELKRSIIFKK